MNLPKNNLLNVPSPQKQQKKQLTFQQQFFGDPVQYSHAKPLSPHKAVLR